MAGQVGNDHPTVMPTGFYDTADGHIKIAASRDALWRRFCEAAGAGHLLEHPDFATSELRSANRAALNAAIAAVTRKQPNRHWNDALNAPRVPCGPINSIDQTFPAPHVAHLWLVTPPTPPVLRATRVVVPPPAHADPP